MNLIRCLIAGCMIVAMHPAEPKLPVAPSGYRWLHVPAMSAYILKPSGWEAVQAAGAESTLLQLSGEDRRLSLQMNPAPSNKPELEDIVTSLFRNDRYDILRYSEPRVQGVFTMQDLLLSDRNAPGIVVRSLVIRNQNTGTFYILRYQAASKEWQSAESQSKVIFNALRLETEK